MLTSQRMKAHESATRMPLRRDRSVGETPLVISSVLGEAWSVYRRLFVRSVLVAGLIFAVISLAQAFAVQSGSAGPTLVVLLLSVLGGLLVQGALVLVVSDLHEGHPAAQVSTYYDRTRSRLGTLLGVSVLYSIGAIVIVPIARWALAVPLVMIEGLGWREALRRSSQLVRGRTGSVLLVLVIAAVASFVARLVVGTVFGFIPGFVGLWAAGTIGSAVAAPYEAHVLTVLYYRLTDPEQPVLPVLLPGSWRSIWDEDPPA